MSILTPDQAAQILERMQTTPPSRCDLCQTPFSDDTPARQTRLGPFPAWLCSECLQRHEAMLERRLTGEVSLWEE